MPGHPAFALSHERFSWARTALWSLAAMLALCSHLAAAYLALQVEPDPAGAAAAPEPILIDLAPMPSAPEESAAEEAFEDPQPAEDVLEPAETAQDAPDEPVEPEVIEEPVEPEVVEEPEAVEPPEPEAPEVEEAEPEPVEQEPVEEPEPSPDEEPVVEEVDVPLPQQRPTPPRVLVEREQARPSRTVDPAPPPERRKAAPAPARSVPEAAAPAAPVRPAPPAQPSRGAAPSVSPARWQARLLGHLERYKRFPAAARARRAEGTAHVRFSIDGGGNVLDVALARSSGVPELDQEVVAMVRRASPVPAPPADAPRTITAPVRFSIR
ncbi:energy transducer TonB family protein [Faunimonas sp. B44]|uniref:energy transducer TonB family protein n=1 Tax=Faunimonas sp. B44 TaxID=3461493 RepID=UPI004043D0D2